MHLTSCLMTLLIVSSAAAACEPVPENPGPIGRKMGQPFYSGGILPTPRQVDYRDASIPLIDGPEGRWLCRADFAGTGRARPLAERLWKNRITPYTSQFPGIEENPADGGIPVDFRIATEGPARDLPPQGYVLEITPQGITCLGRDEAGVVNGLASFLQLLHVEDDRLVARCATVKDWPTFTTRYTAEYHLPGPDFFDWMMAYKINGFAACYPGMRWMGLDDTKREGLKVIGEYVQAYSTMDFMVQFHVGGRGGCRPIDCGNEADVELLLETIRETLTLSRASHVMICYDDVKAELQPHEKGRWERPAQAHGDLMDHVYEAVKTHDPSVVVSFCSPHYQGRHHRRWRETNPDLQDALQYMADLKAWKNRDIRIVWTGPVTESRWIVQEDLDHYLGLVGADRKLFYWDNTWHYHQPLRNFHAEYLPGFVDHCADRTSYVNINGTRPIGRFFCVTANDYYWNPEAFDSKRSRRCAVAQFMGPAAVAAAERLYEIRGEDYFVFFKRDVNLDAFEKAIGDLEAASLDPEIPAICRDAYVQLAAERKGR